MISATPFKIVHAIAQLRFGAGRYVVDTAIAQNQRDPGGVAVAISDDAEAPWQSSSALVDELTLAGVPVYRCGDFFHRRPSALKSAAEALRLAVASSSGEWPQNAIVHAHTAMAATVARWACAPRVVLTCHGWGPNRPAEFDLQDALAYSLCDVVTSPSEHWAAVVREKTARDSVNVIPYGLNLDRFQTAAARTHDGPPRIVSVGELSHRKGADLLLEAMPLVWTRNPEAELHFIGDGELGEELREQAHALDGRGTRVVFHGQVEDPATMLDGFDVFALASRSDNQPIAIIEAMAMGLPVVSTRVGGIAELIEGARCGFVVPPENVYELGMALSVLADTSAAGRRELGEAGSACIRARFDVASHVDALARLYGTPTHAKASRLSSRQTFSASTSPVRLNIGCDTNKREGWVNVDSRSEVSPEIVAKAHELTMFPDGSVDTVEAVHLFEHLPLHEARAALSEWARVLRPGGELLLEMPDFDMCVRLLGHAHDGHGFDLAMVGIYGWPRDVERDGPEMAHKWGWSPLSLSIELGRHGFADVEQVPIAQTWRPAAQIGRDFRIRAVRRTTEVELAA